MLMLALLMLALMFMTAASMTTPPMQRRHVDFLHACHSGDLLRVHRTIVNAYEEHVDALDSGLLLSSGQGHLHVMHYLIEIGAGGLDLALYSAAVHNQVGSCKFLISKDRDYPASDIELALSGAGKHNSYDAEFYLLTKINTPRPS